MQLQIDRIPGGRDPHAQPVGIAPPLEPRQMAAGEGVHAGHLARGRGGVRRDHGVGDVRRDAGRVHRLSRTGPRRIGHDPSIRAPGAKPLPGGGGPDRSLLRWETWHLQRAGRSRARSVRRGGCGGRRAPRRRAPATPTLAQLVGQRLVVAITGTHANAQILARIRAGQVGGVILFCGEHRLAAAAEGADGVAASGRAGRAGGRGSSSPPTRRAARCGGFPGRRR